VRTGYVRHPLTATTQASALREGDPTMKRQSGRLLDVVGEGMKGGACVQGGGLAVVPVVGQFEMLGDMGKGGAHRLMIQDVSIHPCGL